MGHRVLPGAQDRLAPGRAVAQLAALADVHELLTRNGIEYWLFGGWAVDFYAGTVTRPHDDVEVAAPEPDEDGGTGYEREGDERGELEGVRARLIALEALRRGKSASRDDPVDAAKDRADALVLDAL
jgi:hypothetical protein